MLLSSIATLLHYEWWKPLRDRQIHTTVGLFGWHHRQQRPPHRPSLLHIYISKALPSVYSTLLYTPHTPFIGAHFTASSQHSQSSSLTPPALLYSCYSFRFSLRFPKTPIQLKVVGKLEVGLVLLQAKMINCQAAVVNNSPRLLKQLRLRRWDADTNLPSFKRFYLAQK
jgi:hypothetical protein